MFIGTPCIADPRKSKVLQDCKRNFKPPSGLQSQCKDAITRFTTVPLKPISDNYVKDIFVFPGLKGGSAHLDIKAK